MSPMIEISAIELMALQRQLDRSEIDTDDLEAPPSYDEWRRAREANGERVDPEDFEHDIADEKVLYRLYEACPICGDVECDDGVNYIGAQPIHASQHPENRRWENPRGY